MSGEVHGIFDINQSKGLQGWSKAYGYNRGYWNSYIMEFGYKDLTVICIKRNVDYLLFSGHNLQSVGCRRKATPLPNFNPQHPLYPPPLHPHLAISAVLNWQKHGALDNTIPSLIYGLYLENSLEDYCGSFPAQLLGRLARTTSYGKDQTERIRLWQVLFRQILFSFERMKVRPRSYFSGARISATELDMGLCYTKTTTL